MSAPRRPWDPSRVGQGEEGVLEGRLFRSQLLGGDPLECECRDDSAQNVLLTGSVVEVRIGQDRDGRLEAAVITPPPVGAATTAHAAPALPGTGTGLIGLAERATLAGGKLDHGPSPEGGYALHATFPSPT